jgi:hypothetical protein
LSSVFHVLNILIGSLSFVNEAAGIFGDPLSHP